MASLYDKPDIYDIYYNAAKEAPLIRHYQAILKDLDIKTILDSSIGSGNLTFALADMGYDLSGSDISRSMLEACQRKMEARDLNFPLYEADFTKLNTVVHKQFDMVMTTGNSLPHVDLKLVRQAIQSMKACIKDREYIYIDLRNWDKIINEKKRFQYYTPHFKDDLRINVVQARDYVDDQVIFNFLYAFEKENKIIETQEKSVSYHPLYKNQLMTILEDEGFKNIQIYNFINHDITSFDQMDWYVLIGQKG